MKISFLSFLLILLLSSCGGEEDQKEDKSSNGSDSSESENIEAIAAEAVDFKKSLELKRVDGVKLVHDTTTQKLFTGWAKATHENGQLEGLVHVKDGRMFTIYEFYENGKKHFKIENSKDRKNKSAISWKPNGEKCPETNLNNGNGVFVRYFETGRKESEQNFKDYEKDGVCTDWYENGNKSKEVSYQNGKLDGFEIFYLEDGTEEIRFIYKDGEQIGRHKEGEGEPAKPLDDPAKVSFTNGMTAKVWIETTGSFCIMVHLSKAGEYPKSLNDLLNPPVSGSSPQVKKVSELLDPWGNQYQYKYPGVKNPEGFDLWTVTPDGKITGNW